MGEALKQLETGATMSRRGWNGKSQYVTWVRALLPMEP